MCSFQNCFFTYTLNLEMVNIMSCFPATKDAARKFAPVLSETFNFLGGAITKAVIKVMNLLSHLPERANKWKNR